MASKAIIGGLLTGLGQGLIDQAEEMRLAAIERARALREQDERTYQEGREDLRHERNLERDEARHERSSGLLSTTRTTSGGEVVGITRSGGVVDTGVKAPVKDKDKPGAMSAEDKRIWDITKERYTSEEYGQKKTDWSSMAAALRQQGREDLAKLASGGSDGTTMDVNSDEYLEAQRMADEWISGQAGWFSRDSEDFKAFGGNREQARQAKTMEFYRQLTGTNPAVARDDQGQGSSAQDAKPLGSGTQTDPYRATSQSHVEWFKQNAPAGSVIEADGKLYRK